MQVQDLSHNRRIWRLTQLNRELEKSRNPTETFATLQRAFLEVDGFVAFILLSTTGLPTGHYRVLCTELDNRSNGAGSQACAEPDVVHSNGIMATIIAHHQPQLIQDVDWALDPYFRQTLTGYSSVMAVPLAGHHLRMTWAILLRRPPERFTESDLEEAIERAAMMSALLENQLLAIELARANEQVDRDAGHVGELQRLLLPASLPRIAGLQIVASYEPTGRAGGDLYDFFPLDEFRNTRDDGENGTPGRWCVFIGDAAGHGMAAAVVMAIVQAVLRAHPPGTDGPAALLSHANRHLCDKRFDGFFTAFLGVYDPISRQLRYAIAGHPPPLLKRSTDGSIRALDAAVSYPLGIDDTETFNEATVQLERGDTLLLYTDGITESRDQRDETFGRERLVRMMGEADTRGPAELIQRLRSAVRAHQHGQPAVDDQTLVAALVL